MGLRPTQVNENAVSSGG